MIRLRHSISLLYMLLFSGLILFNIIFTRGFQSIGQTASFSFKIITALCALAAGFLLLHFQRSIARSFSRLSRTRVGVILTVSILIQLVILCLFEVSPSWDFAAVLHNSARLLNGLPLNGYPAQYPNNLMIICLLALIGEVTGHSLILYQLFNIGVITLSQYLIYRITNKIAGRAAGCAALIFSIIFLPLIFYAPIVYTDTFSLLFVLLSLDWMIDSAGKLRGQLSSILPVSFLLMIGYLVKGLLIVNITAYCFILLLFLGGRKKWYFILPLIVLIAGCLLFHSGVYASGMISRQSVQKLHLPFTHWLVMGENNPHYGKYLHSDVARSQQMLHEPRSQQIRSDWNELKNRITKRGVIGNIKFFKEKIAETWTDGTLYVLNVLGRYPVFPQSLRALTHHPGDWIFQGLARIEWLLLLAGSWLAAFQNKNKPIFSYCMLTAIGFFLFLLIWETRSRYLLSLVPLLIILAAAAYLPGQMEGKK